AEAVVSETAIDVIAKSVGHSRPDRESDPRIREDDREYLLRANGQVIKFDGWYKVYAKAPIKEQEVPEVKVGENLDLKNINPIQKFTEPPPKYTEATLIRDLEKHGIGRPSTYAPTISTLYDRFYIERLEARKIGPTPIGTTVVDFLVKYFPNIVDYKFTAAMEEDLDKLDTDPALVLSYQHDLVLNGSEIGGGSLRITKPEIQKKIFDLIGFKREEKAYFEHMLKAFSYGAPPHGGIACGLDRLLAILEKEPSIREVIAFPKTGEGRDLLMDAPSGIREEQLKELGIVIKNKGSDEK
ncbi:MAG: aspartyl-tRNA synthetase, partial [Parcubacteria group bacterium Gr01-1014_107]